MAPVLINTALVNRGDVLGTSKDYQMLLDEWVDGALFSLKDVIRTFYEKGTP